MRKSFWNNNHDLTKISQMIEQRIPFMGEIPEAKKHPALEKYRKAANCYYDLFNNGLWNRAKEFSRIFGLAAIRDYSYFRNTKFGRVRDFDQRLYERTDAKMEQFVRDAAIELGILNSDIYGRI